MQCDGSAGGCGSALSAASEKNKKGWEKVGEPEGLRGVRTTMIVFDSCHIVLGKKRSRNIAKMFYLQYNEM
eukprot:2562837-Rhodomonas_salina.1